MADVSFQQMNFLGGKWSIYAQGRAEKEQYRTAMNECLNSFPIEEGAWIRRSGTLYAASTRNGVVGVNRKFEFNQATPYTLEFTAGHMRMLAGLNLVLTNQFVVTAISTATPAVVTAGNHGLTTGDQMEFQETLLQQGTTPSGLNLIFNRQFAVTVIDSSHFSISDPVTGAGINGANLNTTGWSVTGAKILDIATPYTAADLPNIRVVQDQDLALILCPGHPPQQIVNLEAISPLGFQTISFGAVTMLDGPYLDPPVDGSTLTASAASGTVTLTASAITSINGGSGFQSTDVGRHVRLFSEPAAYNPATNYTTGNAIKFANTYWVALANSTGKQPDLYPALWAISPTSAAWTWAIIQTVVDTSHVTATIQAADPQGFLAGGALVNGTLAMTFWQLGVYSNTTVWPSGGVFHEGRFWLFSAIKNRFDATMSDNGLTPEGSGLRFTPTMLDGTVADDNGISYTLQATDLSTIFWMASDHAGIIVGTQAGEWVIQAAATNDPLTPTSIQAHRMSKYGASNIEPAVTPLATLFVNRYTRKVMEYLGDVFSGRFIGTNLTVNSKDLFINGIAEITYQQETTPIVWIRDTAGLLYGMTYKRENPFGTQAAQFAAPHRHTLGSGRIVTSLRAGPAWGGQTDSTSMVTLDQSTGIYFQELLAPNFEEGAPLTQADFLDAAVTPTAAEISGSNLIFYGLEYIAGKTITVFIAGVDAGDFVVSASGVVTVPLPAGFNNSGLLTQALLASMTPAAAGPMTYLNLNIQVAPVGSGHLSPFASLISYVAAHNSSLHNNQMSQNAVFDFDNNFFYYLDGDGFYHQFVITTQVESYVTSTPPTPLANTNTPSIGHDGNIYFGYLNSADCGRFNVTTKTQDLHYADTHGLVAAGYSVCIKGLDGNEYLLILDLNSGQGGGGSGHWQVICMTAPGGPVWTGAQGQVDEGNGSLSPGNLFPTRGPTGSAFFFAIGTLGPGFSGTAQIGVYRASAVTPSSAGVGKIGVINPAQVHAGLTSVSIPNAYGMCYDDTDGNLIIMLHGSDGNAYLTKISTRDASVLWSIQMNNTNSQVNFRNSRVRGGQFFLLSGGSPFTVYEVNTLTGVANTSNTESLMGPGDFATDDKLGMYVENTNNIGTTCWTTFGQAPGGGSIIPATVYTAPSLLGFTYNSDGQILRPISPNEAGTSNGPSLGKTRRGHMLAMLLAQTQGISWGTDFTHLNPVPLTMGDQNTPLPANVLFSGVTWDTVDDDYSFDSMPCWRVSRPYPATVAAVGEFLHGEDR